MPPISRTRSVESDCVGTGVLIQLGSWELFRRVWTTTMNTGAFSFGAATPPPAGQPLEVTMRLPDRRELRFAAMVSHVAAAVTPGPAHQVGVRIVSLDAESQFTLDDVLVALKRGALP